MTSKIKKRLFGFGLYSVACLSLFAHGSCASQFQFGRWSPSGNTGTVDERRTPRSESRGTLGKL